MRRDVGPLRRGGLGTAAAHSLSPSSAQARSTTSGRWSEAPAGQCRMRRVGVGPGRPGVAVDPVERQQGQGAREGPDDVVRLEPMQEAGAGAAPPPSGHSFEVAEQQGRFERDRPRADGGDQAVDLGMPLQPLEAENG